MPILYRQLIIFNLLLIGLVSNAQTVPGFLGKKSMLYYDLGTSINWRVPTENPNSPLISFINFKHYISLEQAVSKSKSFGGNVAFSKMHYDTDINSLNNVATYKFYNTTQIGLYFKKFSPKRGSIAPIGFYTKYKVHGLIVNSFSNPNSSTEEISAVIPGGSVSLGRNLVLDEKMIINMEAEINLSFSSNQDVDVSAINANHWAKVKVGIGFPFGRTNQTKEF